MPGLTALTGTATFQSSWFFVFFFSWLIPASPILFFSSTCQFGPSNNNNIDLPFARRDYNHYTLPRWLVHVSHYLIYLSTCSVLCSASTFPHHLSRTPSDLEITGVHFTPSAPPFLSFYDTTVTPRGGIIHYCHLFNTPVSNIRELAHKFHLY